MSNIYPFNTGPLTDEELERFKDLVYKDNPYLALIPKGTWKGTYLPIFIAAYQCECGAESIRVNTHSHWCPAFKAD